MSDHFEPIRLILPLPPSVNDYYSRGRRGQVFVAKPGKDYRQLAAVAYYRQCARAPHRLECSLRLWVWVQFADHRTHDLGNLDKCLSDTLADIGVYRNDKQICDLRYIRCPVAKPGKILVEISPFVLEESENFPGQV